MTLLLRCCLAPHFTLIVFIQGVELLQEGEIWNNLLIHNVMFSQPTFHSHPQLQTDALYVWELQAHAFKIQEALE